MWDSWCGFPHPCSDDPASSPRWYSFLQPISHAWAASQPTCLRQTELLLPATPWAPRMITHCRETSAVTVWKADTSHISHAATFPCCCMPSQHRSYCRCHGPDPAWHLPGTKIWLVPWQNPAWEMLLLPVTHQQHPFTPPQNWYHGRILFP